MPAPDARQANAPANRGVSSADLGGTLRGNSNPTATLLHAIESATGSPAKPAGNSWRSLCPCCGGRSYKVKISEADSGGVLIHCYAGCDAIDLVHAVGLQLSDLMPIRDSTPEGRKAARAAQREGSILCALEVIRHEAKIVRIVAGDVIRGDLSEADHARCIQADTRIEQALEAINVRVR